MGSTLRSTTLRWSPGWLLVYMYSLLYIFVFFSFCGRVVIYVFFFTVADVK
jgi:hypothetical protein